MSGHGKLLLRVASFVFLVTVHSVSLTKTLAQSPPVAPPPVTHQPVGQPSSVGVRLAPPGGIAGTWDQSLPPGRRTTDLPTDGGAPQFRARVTIDPQPQAGYLGCLVRLDASAGFPADRRFVLRLSPVPGGTFPPGGGIVAEIPIVVRQGDRRVSLQRRVPAETVGDGYLVELLEDGRVLEGYADEIGSAIPRRFQLSNYLLNRELAVRVLPLSDPELEHGQTASSLTMHPATEAATGGAEGTASRPHAAWVLGHATPVSAPSVPAGVLSIRDWRGYQPYDVIVVTPDRLAELQADSTLEFEAIRNWLLMGGMLLLPEADDPGICLRAIQAGGPIEPFDGNAAVWTAPVGAGQVIGVARRGSNDRVRLADWLTAMHAVETNERRSLTVRRGIEPVMGDSRFGRWLIPGVAEPPVYTFMGLLTAFVILVGPVAYRQTIRSGRGYLMFVIAPLLAVLTTATMLTYGIVSDGFGTVARIRQLTWIDGHSGDAAERVRATYFAGLRPSDGLRFPGDAEVLTLRMPVEETWGMGDEERVEVRGRVTVGESSQVFSPSFLASRQQRQFVFHQPRSNLGVLRLDPVDSSQAHVSSSLEFPVEDFIARDANGDYWTAGLVENGAIEVDCQQLEELEAAKALARLYGQSRLVEASGRSRSRNRGSRTAGWSTALPSRLGLAPEADEGVFEHWLMRYLQLNGALPKSTFVAVAEVSPDVVSVESAEQVESIRIVFGTLPPTEKSP